jgi:hypothetical protein
LFTGPQGSVVLAWSAIPGRHYRVQFKNSLDDPAWTNLGAVVLASGLSATSTDTTIGHLRQRFYRVVMVD